MSKNWFLFALLSGLAIGFWGAEPLSMLVAFPRLNWAIVAATMFLMAWPIEFGHLRSAVVRPLAPGLASLLNVGLIPLLVWPFAPLFGLELGGGIVIAAATPCTLATASVWTRRAGGNDGVSMLVTLITNGTCFLVMPFWIYWQTGRDLAPSLLINTIYNLFFFVVIPIAIGQTLRIDRRSASWATANKPLLSGLALVGILMMVLIGSVSMGLRVDDSDQTSSWLEIIILGVFLGLIHVAVFWLAIYTGRWLGLRREEWIAMGFAGSQKTLMIGLSVAITLGFSITPIILYHSIQLIVDRFSLFFFSIINSLLLGWYRVKECKR